MFINSAATTYFQNAVLNHILRNTAYTPAATTYVGLCTDVGATQEVTGTGYVRKAISWSAASGFEIVTSADISWGPLTASWGDVWSAGIYDASTGGNQLAYGALEQAKKTATNDTLTFSAAQLIVGMRPTSTGYPTTTYLAQKILDLVFRNIAWTPPATVYAALFTDAGANSEIVATGYARQAASFSAASGGSTSNSANINFTVTASYGTVSAAGIYDAATAGNRLLWAPLDTPVTTNAGDTFRFDTTTNTLRVAVD